MTSAAFARDAKTSICGGQEAEVGEADNFPREEVYSGAIEINKTVIIRHHTRDGDLRLATTVDLSTGDLMWTRITACALLTLSAMSTEAAAQCQSNAQLSCAVYNTCVDKYCPCENTNDGYFLRYGKKYCDRFLAGTGWSDRGKKWRDQTLLCLQEKIVPRLSIVEHPTCDCRAMKQFAFETHVECYTQKGASSARCCSRSPARRIKRPPLSLPRAQVDVIGRRVNRGVGARCLSVAQFVERRFA